MTAMDNPPRSPDLAMTTTATLSSAANDRGVAIIENPTASRQLDELVDAIRFADVPAFFTIWQDGSDSIRLFTRALGLAGLAYIHLIRPEILAPNLTVLERRPSILSATDSVVFLGCLSGLSDVDSRHFNAARDRLLGLSTKIIFVESIADERKVRLGFPDVLSQVSYDCRLFLRAGEEDPFAMSEEQRQAFISKSEAAAPLSGTVHELRAGEVICWLEVAPGTLVKFAVPLPFLQHLNPESGLELHWSPGAEGRPPQFWKREPEPTDPERVREVKELNRRFREGLKDWQPRVPEDQ